MAGIGGAQAAADAMRMTLGRLLVCSSTSGYFGVKARRSGGVTRLLGVLGSSEHIWYTPPAGASPAHAARASDILVLLMRRYRLALGCAGAAGGRGAGALWILAGIPALSLSVPSSSCPTLLHPSCTCQPHPPGAARRPWIPCPSTGQPTITSATAGTC